MAKLFIGMPIYNGARFLEHSIESIRNQTFADWTMLISDNASTDETSNIIRRAIAQDSRIQSVRQKTNIGGERNFEFVLNQAKTPYFMWASDDLWDKDFIKVLMQQLETNNEYGLAFTNIVNIDATDHIIREYPSFRRFTAKSSLAQAVRFSLDPEKLGKANFLYSIFRTEVIKNAWKKSPFNELCGTEMCLVLAAIAVTRIYIEDRVLFKKRLLEKEGGKGLDSPWQTPDAYVQQTLSAVLGTDSYEEVKLIMMLRKELIAKEQKLAKFERITNLIKHPYQLPQKLLRKISGRKN